jgi:hypothetical protein
VPDGVAGVEVSEEGVSIVFAQKHSDPSAPIFFAVKQITQQ